MAAKSCQSLSPKVFQINANKNKPLHQRLTPEKHLKNTCGRVFLIKLHASGARVFL